MYKNSCPHICNKARASELRLTLPTKLTIVLPIFRLSHFIFFFFFLFHPYPTFDTCLDKNTRI